MKRTKLTETDVQFLVSALYAYRDQCKSFEGQVELGPYFAKVSARANELAERIDGTEVEILEEAF